MPTASIKTTTGDRHWITADDAEIVLGVPWHRIFAAMYDDYPTDWHVLMDMDSLTLEIRIDMHLLCFYANSDRFQREVPD